MDKQQETSLRLSFNARVNAAGELMLDITLLCTGAARPSVHHSNEVHVAGFLNCSHCNPSEEGRIFRLARYRHGNHVCTHATHIHSSCFPCAPVMVYIASRHPFGVAVLYCPTHAMLDVRPFVSPKRAYVAHACTSCVAFLKHMGSFRFFQMGRVRATANASYFSPFSYLRLTQVSLVTLPIFLSL